MRQAILERLFWATGWVYDFSKIATWLLLVGLVTHYFLYSVMIVRGQSMVPNYVDGEVLVVDKLTYNLRSPKRGDVIAMHFPGEADKRFIKRIIGLPGDTVAVKNGKTFVNNQLLAEEYLDPNLVTQPDLERKLNAGEYFVFGDNRPASSDSRAWGAVPSSFIIGKVATPLFKLPSIEAAN